MPTIKLFHHSNGRAKSPRYASAEWPVCCLAIADNMILANVPRYLHLSFSRARALSLFLSPPVAVAVQTAHRNGSQASKGLRRVSLRASESRMRLI